MQFHEHWMYCIHKDVGCIILFSLPFSGISSNLILFYWC